MRNSSLLKNLLIRFHIALTGICHFSVSNLNLSSLSLVRLNILLLAPCRRQGHRSHFSKQGTSLDSKPQSQWPSGFSRQMHLLGPLVNLWLGHQALLGLLTSFFIEESKTRLKATLPG